jgi:hypothetical protein
MKRELFTPEQMAHIVVVVITQFDQPVLGGWLKGYRATVPGFALFDA